MKIVINGRVHELQVTPERIAYEDILALLRQKGQQLTVTYAPRGGMGGSLLPGETIALSEGMVFNAVRTGNA